jgi:hypothetical protein
VLAPPRRQGNNEASPMVRLQEGIACSISPVITKSKILDLLNCTSVVAGTPTALLVYTAVAAASLRVRMAMAATTHPATCGGAVDHSRRNDLPGADRSRRAFSVLIELVCHPPACCRKAPPSTA